LVGAEAPTYPNLLVRTFQPWGDWDKNEEGFYQNRYPLF